jgi:hypothetical protein
MMRQDVLQGSLVGPSLRWDRHSPDIKLAARLVVRLSRTGLNLLRLPDPTAEDLEIDKLITAQAIQEVGRAFEAEQLRWCRRTVSARRVSWGHRRPHSGLT